jgi:hypothetical protein
VNGDPPSDWEPKRLDEIGEIFSGATPSTFNPTYWDGDIVWVIKAPMFVIDYVIVHELAHLMEGNHSPRFWGIVRAHTPFMEKAKAWLKEHGQVLEDDV